jgi:hypothetical protein
MVNQQPHLNYTKGANGTTNDLNPSGYQNNIKQRELQGLCTFCLSVMCRTI